MSTNPFNSYKLRQAKWRVNYGRFSTWRFENFYWHGPTRFNVEGKSVLVLFHNLEKIPKRKIWYLSGLRQHLWRRCQKIRGFIPFIGIDLLNFSVIFVLYQVRPIRPDLREVLNAFLASTAYTKLKNQVYG